MSTTQQTNIIHQESILPSPKLNIQYDINPNLSILKFVTHNVQGINNDLKLRLWLEYCHKEQYHIVIMTETKLAENENLKYRLI